MKIRWNNKLDPAPLIFISLAFMTWDVSAQELEFSVSPSPVGSGARAAGMANAFVATADDATSASWNPAGLVQLEEPELSIVGAFNYLRESFSLNDDLTFGDDQSIDESSLNFLSFVWPLPRTIGSRNATLSIAYQHKYEFARTFEGAFRRVDNPGTMQEVTHVFDSTFDQEGGIGAITPALAMELTNTLSIGVALNLWRDNLFAQNEWESDFYFEQTVMDDDLTFTFTERTLQRYRDLKGENYSIGLLWDFTSKWNLGVRYDTKFRAEADYHERFEESGSAPVLRNETRKIQFPATSAIGIAYRRNDKLTISADASWTDWNDFYFIRADGRRISLVDASDIDDPASATDLDTTITARLGAEYLFIPNPDDFIPVDDYSMPVWALRAGVFYDEEPATDRPDNNTTLNGSGSPDRFYGVALGLGLQAKQRFNFDMAYQFRWGNSVNEDFIRGVEGFSEDVRHHRLLFSMIVYF